MNGQWFSYTRDSLLKVPLRIGQAVSFTVSKTDAGPQVSSAEAVLAGSGTSALTYEGNITGDPTAESEEWIVGGLTFTETASTRLDLAGGAAADGARAVVEATRMADGELVAQTITVLNATTPDDEVYLVGTFEGSRSGSWIVSGLKLSPKNGASEPAAGTLVAIDATGTDGTLTVKKLAVIQAPGDPTLSRFTGTAISIQDTTWATETGEVRVASRSTTVSGRPVEGARAIIWYRPGSDGVSQATYVHVLDQDPVVQPAEPTPSP